MAMFTYKSFCWSFGTTSFRTKNFNKTIEEQLRLLETFWEQPGMDEASWNNNIIQQKYYDFLRENNFVDGEANRKDKDAREKTSGLVDIGLINAERKITNVGETLLEIASGGNYEMIGPLHIPNDSFIYFKQLLKFGVGIDGKYIRPFIVILYSLSKLNYLTFDEFTYLIPLCIDRDVTEIIIDKIIQGRRNKLDVDTIIINTLLKKENYSSALEYLLEHDVTSDIICEVGMNRKSRKYDLIYYDLYLLLLDKYINKVSNKELEIFDCVCLIKNIGKFWKELLFDASVRTTIKREPKSHYKKTEFDFVKNEDELKVIFFKYMHLFKAKATLEDYFDLNRRYIRTTNCITFEDNKVELDVIPKVVINNSIDKLYRMVDEVSRDLYLDVELKNISDGFDITESELLRLSSIEFNKEFNSLKDVYDENEVIRYKKFNQLIDKKFNKVALIELLGKFENREDSYIINYLESEADVPTIFEYVLGIIWYIISDKKGKILDFMKLSLDADLLPRTHAAGGGSDIVYEYDETKEYPNHTMLLEATLADKTNQRRMEMEPVSRHLGDHILTYNNKDDYCTFITNYLDPNVISDFRQRKSQHYYDRFDSSKFIEGMKIIMLETKLLKHILDNNVRYDKLYQIFDKAYNENMPPIEWYKSMIEKEILGLK